MCDKHLVPTEDTGVNYYQSHRLIQRNCMQSHFSLVAEIHEAERG